MLPVLTNPFHSLAVWLVGLLPAGSGELATGLTVMLAIFLVLAAILVPIALVGAAMERHARRDT